MKIKTPKKLLLASLITISAAWMAQATPVLVPDFSFEADTNIPPGGTTAAPDVGPDWHASGNSGVYLADINGTNDFTGATLPAPADGTNYLVENIKGNPARCWQAIGTLQPNTIYTLTVAVGNSLADSGTDTGQGFIGLINGITPFNTIIGSAPIDSSTVAAGTFTDFTLSITNGYQTSGDLLILFQGNAGTQILFDNVRLDAVSTPPAALALPIGVAPSNTVFVGTPVILSEDPSGTAPFTYQWQTDNGTGGATWSNVGSSTNNLSVDTSAFTPGTPVEYQVIVSNGSGSSTSAPVVLTANNGGPNLVGNTIPALGSDVVGSSVTFSAQFQGTQPMAYQWEMVDLNGNLTPVAGETNSTLTLTNLQTTDSGFYYLEASNPYGTVDSAMALFLVTNTVANSDGVVISDANQCGLGGSTLYYPTWTVATNGDLLLDASPTASGGNFQLEGSGGIPFLTDGQFGFLTPEGNASIYLATCGNSGGTNLVYTLPASATGWDVTNITVYGGWSDTGRIDQRYMVYYSTVAAPTVFNSLIANVTFQPENTTVDGQNITLPGQQCATRVTITSTNGALASGVAALKFNFFTLSSPAENGYEGYAEFQAFGSPSAALPVLVTNTTPASGFDVVGSQVTFSAGFSSSTPMTFQWLKDGVAIPAATNSSLTISNLQVSDSAQNPGYSLVASNATGGVQSSPSPFLVNPVAAADSYNVIDSLAGQTGGSATLTPTWILNTGSLIGGLLPTSAAYGGGNFNNEGAGGIPILTDGQYGAVGASDNATLATMGNGNAGHTLIYTLPAGATYGYDLTNIATFSGWTDDGRDAQAYTVSYSTVQAPNTFVVLDTVSQVPNQLITGTPNAARVSLTSAVGSVLASNVYAVEFDFTTPTASAQENGYSGYAELQLFGLPSAALANVPPAVQQDILPVTASDVVGSSVTFTTKFFGTGTLTYQWQKDGVNIANATSPTLTLSDLQTGDSGSYNVLATDGSGTTSSSTNSLTVNPPPAAVNGTIAAPAYQCGYANLGFTPTWTVAPGSLIAGEAPSSSVGGGNFNIEGCGGIDFLTDGSPGSYGAGNGNLTSAGNSAGTSVTYTLGGSASGYDLNQVVVYAGWADTGRDSQGFNVTYATAGNPTTFVPLTSPQTTFDYSPGGASVPNANRLSVTPSGAGSLAQNVTAVTINFTSVPNGWSGYGQVQLFGTPSVAPNLLKVASTRISGGNLILQGAGGTANAGYTILTTTNLALPLSEWQTNSTGTFDVNGAFSNSIPASVTGNRFFLIRTP